ncbi:phosphoenolpyruvate--protein phosphotransferase [Desulfonatronovibrio hydrogenovorans]|uniref:phosphoenolpyruvate--protein phosphotransferase n=1 Tax=Desulfonatronovibrio hydrogenovorans TaxID=53245 RepID=UPI0004910966|nr:phosphoenolpyruvate--protein phosphotransferase [Desulfonatronovibrio hydrogenovorans]
MAKEILKGIPVSAGIAIGKTYYLNRGENTSTIRMDIDKGHVPEEKNRLREAFSLALNDLEKIRKKIPRELKEQAAIIDSHIMLLKDRKFQNAAGDYIRKDMINAEWALEKAVSDIEKAFSRIEDEYIRERIQDVRLVADRVRSQLHGSPADPGTFTQRMILLAPDLSPADTIELQLDKIMAFATISGGKTSHAGIIARSLQIPAIVGVEGLNELRHGQFVILDGFNGKIIVEPGEDELAHYTELKYQFEEYQSQVNRNCHLPAETIDGYKIQVFANIELFEEVAAVIDNGGEGIGLYRTEYSFLNRDDLPTEEELFEEYRDLASIIYPHKLVIRTLDLGADKIASQFGPIREANPALGLRAIRFCRRHPGLFKMQLRAILRASAAGNISIMFPMISGMQELLEVKKMYHSVRSELKAGKVDFDPTMPMGIMVELPSAVLVADLLAREVDFFSIGTNDLIQYSLGIDRTNKHVSYLYQPLHPAILRSIKHVVDAGHEAGIEVSLCGEVASDPYCVPILMGMQIDSISLNPQAIPGIKRIVRQATMDECKELLKRVLESKDVQESNRLVREMIFTRFPEELMFYTSLIEE